MDRPAHVGGAYGSGIQAASVIPAGKKLIDKKCWGWIRDFLAWNLRPSSPGETIFAWELRGAPPPNHPEKSVSAHLKIGLLKEMGAVVVG